MFDLQGTECLPPSSVSILCSSFLLSAHTQVCRCPSWLLSVEKKLQYFSILAQKTLDYDHFTATLLWLCVCVCVCMFSTWHFLLSSPLVISSNSSPILNEQE